MAQFHRLDEGFFSPESQNLRMDWVARDLQEYLAPIPLTPSTRPGCSKPHPT